MFRFADYWGIISFEENWFISLFFIENVKNEELEHLSVHVNLPLPPTIEMMKILEGSSDIYL